MRRYRFFFLCNLATALELAAQTAVDAPRAEEKQKQQNVVAKEQEKRAQATTTVEFNGEQAFKEKDLRSAVKEQLATVDRYGLTPARADDLAFFVEVFYRKHGYTKASVHYKIENRTPLQPPIHEGRGYYFGTISFHGQTIYGADALRGQIEDLLKQPFTDARVADIPRRLQAYFKTRGYYEVKVEATAEPETAVNGHIPVDVAISPGQLYHFSGEVFVNGLTRLRPRFVHKRLSSPP